MTRRAVARSPGAGAPHPSDALLVVGAIASLQFGSAVARTWFDETGPMGAAALRLSLGALLLLLVVRPRVQRWRWAHWRGALLLGAALGGMNSCIYVAIAHLDFGVAVTIEFLGPLVVALASARRALEVACVLAACAGVALLGLRSIGDLPPIGVAFALAAAACWALYILLTRHLARVVSSLDGIAVAIAAAAMCVVPVGAGDALAAVREHPQLLGAFVLIAVFTCALPYACEYRALRRLPPAVFGVLASLGPALAAAAGSVVLGQRLGVAQWCAILLVCGASGGAVFAARSRPDAPTVFGGPSIQ
ncbi:MAG: EamA family transporter [Thermoleophilia bacterium]|nr:EamA family transporter [Thermoleophilia bacterium]